MPTAIAANNIVQTTPTRPESQGKCKCTIRYPILKSHNELCHQINNSYYINVAVKPGVLRFGPSPVSDMDMSRIPATGLPQTPISVGIVNVSALRPQPNSIISPTSIPATVVAPLPAQALPLNKTAKKPRKEGEPEFIRDRTDVQSPAYSDISDDSTPVADTEVGGKNRIFKWLNKQQINLCEQHSSMIIIIIIILF